MMIQANRTFEFYHKTIFLITALLLAVTTVSAFTVARPPASLQQQRGFISSSSLYVVADAEMEEVQKNNRRKDDDNDDNSDEWTATQSGGFLPKLFHRQRPEIHEVTTIQDYKTVVADEKDQMVVVRFYAPWCRACKAVQPKFRKLAMKNPTVKFVEVPLTKENAFLHDGLGVPSLPYAHIYHPEVGLVDERSINKKVFSVFKDEILKSYIDGYCPVDWESCGDEEDVLQ